MTCAARAALRSASASCSTRGVAAAAEDERCAGAGVVARSRQRCFRLSRTRSTVGRVAAGRVRRVTAVGVGTPSRHRTQLHRRCCRRQPELLPELEAAPDVACPPVAEPPSPPVDSLPRHRRYRRSPWRWRRRQPSWSHHLHQRWLRHNPHMRARCRRRQPLAVTGVGRAAGACTAV